MTTQIFNQDGVANVRDLNPNIQNKYKGCGRGCVVISQEGEVVDMRYRGVVPFAKVAEWSATVKTYKEAGHEFFSCHFSSDKSCWIEGMSGKP